MLWLHCVPIDQLCHNTVPFATVSVDNISIESGLSRKPDKLPLVLQLTNFLVLTKVFKNKLSFN